MEGFPNSLLPTHIHFTEMALITIQILGLYEHECVIILLPIIPYFALPVCFHEKCCHGNFKNVLEFSFAHHEACTIVCAQRI